MTNVVKQLISGSAEIGIANIQMVDTEKFDILLTQEEHLYALFRRDVFWTDREHDTITWDDIKQCPLSLSGGSVRMIMQSSLTDMEHLNVSAITVALVPMDAKEMVNHRKMSRIKLPEFSGDYKKAFITLKGHALSPVAQQFIDFYKAYV